jgi:hypothetical protein
VHATLEVRPDTRDLALPHEPTVGDARFLLLSGDHELAQSFARFGDVAPKMVCEVDAAGGTEALLLDRARGAAEDIPSLVRQQVLFSAHWKIYLEQVISGYVMALVAADARHLDGFTTGDPGNWLAQLASLSSDYDIVSSRFRDCVGTCVGWLDAAARTDRWRIMLPAVFSAMKAILVPETSPALKAG